MTTSATVTLPTAGAPPAPVWRGYRFELTKLLAQWPIRLALAACWLGPAVFVAVVSRQSALPADTVFGRWMGQTGWAGSLVVLAFACSWVLPLLASLVAGDVFAAEDRLGTWRHLLVAVRSPRRIFAAKALASLTVIVLLVAGLAASGIAGGLAAVGNRPLVGLDGHLLQPGSAAGAVLLGWAAALAATLAFAAVGLLASVALGRSPMGLVVPALLALVLGLAQLLPLPVSVRAALPSYAFIAWTGLFTTPAQLGPLLIGVVVSLVWAVAATLLAYSVFMRRDFTNLSNDGVGRGALTVAAAPLVGLLVVTMGVLAVASPSTGSGIDQHKVQQSVATAFGHLYRLQTQQLHRPDVTEEQLASTVACTKGDGLVDADGPGNDWRCVVSWHLPGTTVAGQAIYQLDIASDGQYVADGDGPKEVNGYFQVRTPTGDQPNPLWQFDGHLELLSKG